VPKLSGFLIKSFIESAKLLLEKEGSGVVGCLFGVPKFSAILLFLG